jgi:hypothetical protein
MDDLFPGKIGRRALLTGSAGVAAGVVVAPGEAWAGDAPDAERGHERPISSYPLVKGGVWARGTNLRDRAGRYQARQEHAAAVLNGFVYLIGGFVPIQPPPVPTENIPEPFRGAAGRPVRAQTAGRADRAEKGGPAADGHRARQLGDRPRHVPQRAGDGEAHQRSVPEAGSDRGGRHEPTGRRGADVPEGRPLNVWWTVNRTVS